MQSWANSQNDIYFHSNWSLDVILWVCSALKAVISFSAWVKSRDSTPRIFFLEHKMRPKSRGRRLSQPWKFLGEGGFSGWLSDKNNQILLSMIFLMNKNERKLGNRCFCWNPSIKDRVLCSGMLLYLHHRNSKLFFHPAKIDNFKDEKIIKKYKNYKTVTVAQSKNLLDWKLVV